MPSRPLLLAAALAPAVAVAHPLDGAWTLAMDDEAVVAAQTDAIDRALSSWPGFAVAMARPRLIEANPACPTVTLSVEEDRIRYVCGGSPPYERAVAGVEELALPEGGTVRSKVGTPADGLVLTWIGDEGRRVDRFSVSGGVLSVQATVKAPALPRPVSWTLTYRRDPDEDAAPGD